MIVIYRCQHCGARIEGKYDLAKNKQHALAKSYRQFQDGPPTWLPHDCDPATLGVAQLIAVRDE
jgi:hypothetical protein